MITNKKHYQFTWTGVFYCGDWFEASSIKEAKKQLRKHLEVKRLPRGFEIWEKNNG